MVKEKVTKADLLNIRIGKSETFSMPSYSHCRSAQSLAGQMKNFDPYPRYTTKISDVIEGSVQRSITITRLS